MFYTWKMMPSTVRSFSKYEQNIIQDTSITYFLFDGFLHNQSLVPTDPMSLFNLKRGSPEEEFPYLRWNHTFMGRFLTLKMYTRQYHRATQSGVIFDDIIRPGLEEPGDVICRKHFVAKFLWSEGARMG